MSGEQRQSESQAQPTLVLVFVGTVALLASLWSIVQFLLFIQPFWLRHLPPWALLFGRIFFVLLICVVAFLMLYKGTGAGLVARVWRVLGAHPGWSCVPLALFSVVLLGIGYLKREIPETEIAQKLLSERGMSFSFESLQNQMYLLNSDGLELFIRAGLQPDSLFDALGRRARLTGRDPLITRVLGNINSISDTKRREEAVEKFVTFVLKATREDDQDRKGDLDRPIEIVDETVWGAEKVTLAGVSKTLLGFALSQGSADMVAALLRAGADPFKAGFDPSATLPDTYVFDPFFYVLERSRAGEHWAGEPDVVYEALLSCGFQPSEYATSQKDFPSLVLAELKKLQEQYLVESTPGCGDSPVLGGWRPISEPWVGTVSQIIDETSDRCQVETVALENIEEKQLADGAAVIVGTIGSNPGFDQQAMIFMKGPLVGSGELLLYHQPDQSEHALSQFQADRNPELLILRNGKGAWHLTSGELGAIKNEIMELHVAQIEPEDLTTPYLKSNVPTAGSMGKGFEPLMTSKLEAVSGDVDAGNTAQIYIFSIPRWQAVGIRIEHHEADLCVTLTKDDGLPAKDDGSATAGWLVPAGQAWESPMENLAAGDYRIQVQSMGPLSTFTIGAWGSTPHPPRPEPSRELATLNPWPSEPFDVKDQIDGQEEHYYSIEIVEPSRLTLDLTDLSSDVDMQLTGDQLDEISNNEGTNDEKKSRLLLILDNMLCGSSYGNSAMMKVRATGLA